MTGKILRSFFYISLSTVIAGFVPATHRSASVICDLKWVPAINVEMTMIESVSLWHGYRLLLERRVVVDDLDSLLSQ
jgi:hypothetical protein